MHAVWIIFVNCLFACGFPHFCDHRQCLLLIFLLLLLLFGLPTLENCRNQKVKAITTTTTKVEMGSILLPNGQSCLLARLRSYLDYVSELPTSLISINLEGNLKITICRVELAFFCYPVILYVLSHSVNESHYCG